MESHLAFLLVGHLAVTGCLAGLIWYVQVVHYPGFCLVGESFSEYHAAHVRRTTLVVGVLMPLELLGAACLVWLLWGTADQAAAVVGIILIGVIWLSTALLQVPDHHRLERSFSRKVALRLVRTNWIRTGAWSARLLLAGYLVLAGLTRTG